MYILEEKIKDFLKKTEEMRETLIGEAVDEYFSGLTEDDASNDYNSATIRAAKKLKEGVLSNKLYSLMSGDGEVPFSNLESCYLTVDAIIGKVRIPRPTKSMAFKVLNIAIAAGLGAILGQLVLVPISRLFLGMRDLGLVLGPPIGAFTVALLVLKAGESNRFRKKIQVILGIASVLEVYRLITGGGMLGLWRKLVGRYPGSGFLNSAKRILLYAAINFLLMIGVKRSTCDRESHKDVVRNAVEYWLHEVLILMACLSYYVPATSSPKEAREIALTLGKHLYELDIRTHENLEEVVTELLQDARQIGFEGIGQDYEKSFLWVKDKTDMYRAFGHIEDGNQVFVEERPIIFNGEVLKKGLVRKIRK